MFHFRPRSLRIVAGCAALVVGVGLAGSTPSAQAAKSKKSKTNKTATTVAKAPALVGSWNVIAGSEAGYRVKEKFLAPPADVTAVGRSAGVSGSMNIEKAGTTLVVRMVTVKVDMTVLKSDQERRDNAIKNRGLETAKFVEATFESIGDLSIGDGTKDVGTKAKGKLTLHGVTKEIELDVQAGIRDGNIQVVGTTPIKMSDYAIDPPNVGGFVTVEDSGILEVNLRFAKA